MSDRHAARFYRVLLCTLIGVSLVGGSFLCGKTPFGAPLSVQAVELTNDSIREKEAQVKSIQEERAKIQSSISDIKKIKEGLLSSSTLLGSKKSLSLTR